MLQQWPRFALLIATQFRFRTVKSLRLPISPLSRTSRRSRAREQAVTTMPIYAMKH